MKITIKDMILISMFAALIAIGAFIKIPTPLVPFTLQFIFTAFAGILLGAKRGIMSALLYLAIGLIGLPIFAKGGGITYVFQPTFGYLIGFAGCAFLVGLLTQRIERLTFIKAFVAILCGLIVLYLIGVSYMYMIVNVYLSTPMSIQAAITAGFTPFIVTDVIQSIIIAYTATLIKPLLKKNGFLS